MHPTMWQVILISILFVLSTGNKVLANLVQRKKLELCFKVDDHLDLQDVSHFDS